MQFLKRPTRNLFFTGKGGVGKTSIACAAAVRLADSGKRVLLVSTDPASNLDEVLGVALEYHPKALPQVPTLFAMNLNPETAAAEYRERIVGPFRKLLPATAIAAMDEQFSGSCTLEIAAFNEFARLLADQPTTAAFDHVIFDTAPTGHTLRLLTLPSAWTNFIQANSTGTSCLGPLSGLQAQQGLYQTAVQTLCDPALTTLVLVTRPEITALREAARTSGELMSLGIQYQHLVVNGIFTARDPNDPIAVAMQQRCESALQQTPAAIADLPRTNLPLVASGFLGMESLRRMGTLDATGGESPQESVALRDCQPVSKLPPPLYELIDELERPGRGVILVMGKGGVGKTTIAAAIAVALADRGHPVQLSTTDPAAHLSTTVFGNDLPNLTVSRIDPVAEVDRYSQEVMQTAGVGLDEHGQALLAEDLRSPCTEEIAVFRAFANAVSEGSHQFVVLDTAPTGHTILLLDTALAYHREVSRQHEKIPESVEHLLPRLRDAEFTRVVIVTLPEATPVHEAAALQRDLRRAEIEPFAWGINQSLSPLEIRDPVLQSRQRYETQFIHEVTDHLAKRVALIPWLPNPPVGFSELRKLVARHRDLQEASLS